MCTGALAVRRMQYLPSGAHAGPRDRCLGETGQFWMVEGTLKRRPQAEGRVGVGRVGVTTDVQISGNSSQAERNLGSGLRWEKARAGHSRWPLGQRGVGQE